MTRDYATYARDTHQHSTMSYFYAMESGAKHTLAVQSDTASEGTFAWKEPTLFAETPGVFDVAALQRLYGANTQTRAGNTVYGHDATKDHALDLDARAAAVYTIWDSGGTDTINFSRQTAPVKIDLNPGGFSSQGWLKDNISIALGAQIERGLGGSGNDTLVGSNSGDAPCVLFGGAGDDLMYTGAPGGFLYAEDGNDTLVAAGNGDDRLSGGAEADEHLIAFGGTDTVVIRDGGAGSGGAADKVLFFGRAGVDVIDLSAMDADTRAEGDQAFVVAPFAPGVAGTLRYYTSLSESRADGPRYGLVLEGDTDGNGAADFQVLFVEAQRLLNLAADVIL